MPAFSGNQCKLYYNSATAASPTWVLIEEVGDVSVADLGLSLAEVATRASVFISNLPGLINMALEMDYLYKAGETVFDALRTQFFARTAVQFAVMDGLIATSGSEGLVGYYLIEKFPVDQPLQGAVKNAIRLAPAYFEESAARVEPEWMVVA